MICKTKIQADKLAGYGAAKMSAQGYIFNRVSWTLYHVYKPGQTVPYVVDLCEAVTDITGRFCTCGFAKENRAFGTCKHYVWLVAFLAEIEECNKQYL